MDWKIITSGFKASPSPTQTRDASPGRWWFTNRRRRGLRRPTRVLGGSAHPDVRCSFRRDPMCVPVRTHRLLTVLSNGLDGAADRRYAPVGIWWQAILAVLNAGPAGGRTNLEMVHPFPS